MKIQSPLFHNYHKDQDGDSSIQLDVRPSWTGPCFWWPLPVVLHKAGCPCYRAKQGFLKLAEFFFPTFQYLFCFSSPLLCFITVEIAWCRSDVYLLWAYFSQGTLSQRPNQFRFGCLVSSKKPGHLLTLENAAPEARQLVYLSEQWARELSHRSVW